MCAPTCLGTLGALGFHVLFLCLLTPCVCVSVSVCVCLSIQVKWMMYWIVFALFTTAETATDLFLSW